MHPLWIKPLAYAAIALLTTCPAQGEATLPAPRAPAAAFTPNYASGLRYHATWPAFPLTVAFVHDSNYRFTREQWARRGFDSWLTATQGLTRYQVIADVAAAQVTVRFDPATNDGYTYTSFRDGQITRASVRIGVRRGRANDIACIAAHEFAHSLGVDAHSPDPHDVMYPIHYMGRAWRITLRDYNTLAVLYSGQTSGSPPLG